MMAVMRIVAITDDAVVLRGLERAAGALGSTLDSFKSLAAAALDPAPTAIVMDAEMPEAPEAVSDLKARWPLALVAGFVSNPSRSGWERAEAAGFDLVASRGALAAQLQKKLHTWAASSGKRRARVCDVADLAGRLGVVARLNDAPTGPVAVYHFSGQMCVVEDVCPHAGGRLSEGTLEGTVITCPLHGSQFDVCSGARLRGPADVDIKKLRVEVDGGQVFLVQE
jgi:nitrite reductase/ring-hydroxylating ferredoxin subunit